MKYLRMSWQARIGAAALSITAAVTGTVTMLAGSAPVAGALTMESTSATVGRMADRYNDRVLTLVNRRREAHGLRRLRFSLCASGYAKDWSRSLAQRNAFEHSDLGWLLSRCDAAYASEAIAMVGDGTRPRELVRMWMHSPGHRGLLLARAARASGVSVRWDADRQSWVAVQNFIRR